MVLSKEETTKIWTIGAIIVLGILVFLLVKPVIVSVVSGLILTYLFLPVYRWTLKWAKSKTLSSGLVLIFVGLLIIVPLWYVLPKIVSQFFDVFKAVQVLDPSILIQKLFPSAPQEFIRQAGVTFTALFSKASASLFNSLVNFFTAAPTLLLNFLIVGFVFFFGLRDSDKLIQIAKDVSPLNRAKEKLLIQQFKDITDSIVYGQIVVGIAQGLLAGIGFLIFGVDNAIFLTIAAIFFSMIPILGPYVVYIPVAIFMFASGNSTMAIGYMIYNLVIVSTLDNFLRTYIVSKKSKMNSAVVFVGMIAGMYMFGVIGLLLGPLILAYFLILLQLYQEKELNSLFVRDEEPTEKK